MSDHTALPCASCGYDLRATPREGICPECATPVEKAIELIAIPLRPAWRDSDPRWRRRMVAGAWVMVFIPLIAVLQQSGLAARVPVPFTGYAGELTLADSFVTWVYVYLAFCIGVVLFFSKERGRQRHPLDWTRRWGVFVSYVVLLLGVPLQLFTAALVLVGIGALCLSLPYENHPWLTEFFITIGSGFINYGPHPSEATDAAATLFSTSAILLACVPIYDALRTSGSRSLALVVLAPLVTISLYQIAVAAIWYLDPSRAGPIPPPPFFFEPDLLVMGFENLGVIVRSGYFEILRRFIPEAAKWLPFLAIAIWLSIAQVRAWRRRPAPAPAAT